MPELTPEQFTQVVRAAAGAQSKVKNVRIGDYSVVVDILSKSGKKAYEWEFVFDKVAGHYKYFGAFAAANEPKFFGDAIRQAIKGITRTHE